VVSGLNESSWHTYEIDWTRSYVAFYLDGALVGESTDTSKIPDTPMHWVMQTGLSNSETNLSLLGTGHLQVAWAVAYSPCGSC
jgi:beta-glucanase (GH16 family)